MRRKFVDIKETYKKISGVDIDKQRLMWEESGEGNYGEFLVFSKLFSIMAPTDKVLLNVKVPTASNKKANVDVMLFCRYGIICITVVGLDGSVFGDETEDTWAHVRKTEENISIISPVQRSNYGKLAVKRLVESNIPVYSYIVFTDDEVVLKIKYRGITDSIGKLERLPSQISKAGKLSERRLDANDVNDLYLQFRDYAPDIDNEMPDGGDIMPIAEYVSRLEEQKEEEVETMRKEEKKRYLKKISPFSFILLGIGLVFFIGSIILNSKAILQHRQDVNDAAMRLQAIKESANESVSVTESKLAEMEKQYQELLAEYTTLSGNLGPANWKNLENFELSYNFAVIKDAVVRKSEDAENCSMLSFELQCNGTDYSLAVRKDSTITIKMKDDTVKTGLLKDINKDFIGIELEGGRSLHMEAVPIYDAQPEDIAWVKLSGLYIYQKATGFVDDTYEVEVYRAE